jgi:hypothetical protein
VKSLSGQRELSVVASSVIVMKKESGSAEAGCDSALLDDLDLPPDPFATDEETFWEQRGFTLVAAAETGRRLVAAALAAEPGPVFAGALPGWTRTGWTGRPGWT